LMDQTAKLAKSSKTTVQRNTLNRHDPPWAVSIPQLLTSQRNKWFSTTLDNSKRLHKWGEFSRSRWSPWCQTCKSNQCWEIEKGFLHMCSHISAFKASARGKVMSVAKAFCFRKAI
jgi:hypothetical protein